MLVVIKIKCLKSGIKICIDSNAKLHRLSVCASSQLFISFGCSFNDNLEHRSIWIMRKANDSLRLFYPIQKAKQAPLIWVHSIPEVEMLAFQIDECLLCSHCFENFLHSGSNLSLDWFLFCQWIILGTQNGSILISQWLSLPSAMLSFWSQWQGWVWMVVTVLWWFQTFQDGGLGFQNALLGDCWLQGAIRVDSVLHAFKNVYKKSLDEVVFAVEWGGLSCGYADDKRLYLSISSDSREVVREGCISMPPEGESP